MSGTFHCIKGAGRRYADSSKAKADHLSATGSNSFFLFYLAA